MNNHPIALIILDGFGHRKQTEHNAIALAKKPHLDYLLNTYPHAFLRASGTAVGLLDNYSGNSEVGHCTIGAGRIITQPATLIHNAIHNKTFFDHPMLKKKLALLNKRGGALHIMGLLSDAHIHSSLELLYALLDVAHQHGIKYVYIHPFLDGRDVAPKSALHYLERLEEALTDIQYGSMGSVHGRWYAMDRDNNWERTQKSYRTLTEPSDQSPRHWQNIIEDQYAAGLTDEFIIPTKIDPTSTMKDHDGVIFFNIRPDRARQLTACFADPNFDHFFIQPLQLTFFITPVSYDPDLITDVLYQQQPLKHTLKDELAAAHKTIFSIAETEKYAHISYFFTGRREESVPYEIRTLIPSKKSRDYIHNPCMSASEITQSVIHSLHAQPCDFYLINYANADMVGHSGNLAATIHAIECLDEQLQKLYSVIVESMGGTLFITADHGKAEEMVDITTQQPKTAHTNSLVPFIMVKKGLPKNYPLPVHELADIAPFILKYMGIEVPEEMKKS